MVAGQTFTVSQASGCSYPLAPSSVDIGPAGGTSSFTVTTAAACSWTTASHAPWITIAGGPGGTGRGIVTFTVEGNAMGGAPRSGTITVNDQTFTVNQSAGVSCVYTIAPTSQQFSSAAGGGSFTVNTVLTCPWTVYSNDSWITIVGSPSGAGVGTVSFAVSENPPGNPARTGTISVRGPVFTIYQAAATAADR